VRVLVIEDEPPRRVRPGLVFVVAAAGVAMSNLDTFVVNVALPQIGLHFHQASLGPVSWVLNAYAVIFAALLVPAGTLAGRYGARPVYLSGIALFTGSSLACSLGPGVWWLVGFRMAQAAGAALLIPASLGLLLAAAPADKRILVLVRRFGALFRDAGDDEFAGLEAAFCGRGGQFVTR
jgi:MFS family permease